MNFHLLPVLVTLIQIFIVTFSLVCLLAVIFFGAVTIDQVCASEVSRIKKIKFVVTESLFSVFLLGINWLFYSLVF